MTNNTNLSILPLIPFIFAALQADVGGLVALMNRCYRSLKALDA